MLTTIEGTYREGRIHLKESPAGIREARVLVTFIEESHDSASPSSTGIPSTASSPRKRSRKVCRL
ncbi:MAG: hypothetical protein AB1578_01945 [Thermodesulfobacteriota bacterium]